MQVVNKRFDAECPVEGLQIHGRNARRGDLESIAGSIAANGFYGAVIVQESTSKILAGNHRYQAAVNSGAKTIPVIFLDVDDEAARKILLADNRTADVATWDMTALIEELEAIKSDFGTLVGTGFDEDALAKMADEMAAGIVGTEGKPPTEFKSFDEDIETEHECPKCGYRFSGGKTVPVEDAEIVDANLG